jgi:hypothetical protein
MGDGLAGNGYTTSSPNNHDERRRVMKKFTVLAVFVAVAIMTVGVTVGFAQDDPAPVQLTLDGINYCLLCELSQADVAEANTAYASLNALKVSVAVDSDGKFLEEIEGKTLHYLPTKTAEALLVGEEFRGASVTVTAEYYKDAAAIKVVSFKTTDTEYEDIVTDGPSGQQKI